MKHHPLLLSAVLLICTSVASAQDWPRFRGPTGDGHAKGVKLPTQWGPEKNVAWKVKLPGEGWSSPVIVDGKIYLSAAVPVAGNYSLKALSLDAKTGKKLWEREIFVQDGERSPNIHRKNSHASPTPIVDKDRLYVHFGHQGIACLDLAGKIIWKNKEFAYPPVHGNGGSPILVDGLLIFSCDGARNPFVIALDSKTGKEVWKTPRRTNAGRKFSFTTPLLITVNGQKQVISPGSNVVCAFDPKTGKEIWRSTYDGYSVIPKPVSGHGMVFILTGYGRPKLYAIDPGGKGDVTNSHVKWMNGRSMPHTPSLLLVGDEIYSVSDRGIVSCLDAKTGKEYWTQRLNESFSASPIYADGKIYLLSEEGTGFVIAAGKEFKQLAVNKLNERALASYAVADGALFIRTAEGLYRIEEK